MNDFQQLYLFPTNITLPEGSYEINWSFNSVIPVSIESYLYVEFIGVLGSYQTNVYTLSEFEEAIIGTFVADPLFSDADPEGDC